MIHTRSKMIAAALLSVVLGGLLLWQSDRERQVTRCSASGGVWDGRNSTCAPAAPGILLERDLKRT